MNDVKIHPYTFSPMLGYCQSCGGTNQLISSRSTCDIYQCVECGCRTYRKK